ncbi:phytanoyl-CoA dioxygenase family protein [Candidatus Poriferisocius sp.]|uniref:phytanoyl-CoA dioxygenase family protein n=1 Tax=Candidatus Poriferisocius sp. TaxID=3101276 RepID=UPI003B5BCAC7
MALGASGTMPVGWNEAVPPNGFHNRDRHKASESNDNPLGLATPVGDVDIETTPEHRNLVAGDPRCATWTRRYDDPNVVALRDRLAERNGIAGLEVVDPGDVERATAIFHRDGFVAVADALQTEQLEQLRRGVDEVIAALVAADPEGAVGGGAGGLPHRYSFGGTSVSRHMFHRPEWAQLIDLPTTTPILTSIFASPDYIVYGCGGDLALPGAIEYQGLHSDTVWSEIHDPQGGLTMRDLPTPVIAVNFPTIDLTPINGPIRIIPGTHRSNAAIPTLADEPEWMRLSTVCPLQAGSAIIRDARCWHSGTPNLSRDVRAMPGVEYMAPWFRSEALIRSMSYDTWSKLSPHAQRISRYIVCDKGEAVIGEGINHPRRVERERIHAQQLAALSPQAATAYQRRT